MNRHFFLAISLVVLGVVQVKAQTTQVALSHEGNITLFSANKLQDALDASVDGDTLFLNEGTYQGTYPAIDIKKKVSIIGSGPNTVMDSDVMINTTGDLTARMLDGLNCKSIVITNPLNNLVIRKCSFTHFNANAALTNATFDRCWQNGNSDKYYEYFCLNENTKGLKVYNSLINTVYGNYGDLNDYVFINCGISGFYYNTAATFINCVVNAHGLEQKSCLFSYCYMKGTYNDTASNEQNCQHASWGVAADSTPEMLGSDGTPVGLYGGATPYTLEPSIPVVKDFDLKVNTTLKRLNVTVNVESN